MKLRDSLIQLKLSGEPISISNNVKYLGCYYSDNYSLNKQLTVKESTIAGKMSQLEKIGINSQGLYPKTKAFLFNSYIRPIIQYGVDTFSMNNNDIRRIKELEGNSLKDSLGLFRRIYSSNIFKALGLETTVNIIKRNKITLFQRLLKNNYTKQIIYEIINESKSTTIENSLINDVIDLIGLYDLDNMIALSDIFLNELKRQHKLRLENPVIAELEDLLSNRIINIDKIENLTSSYNISNFSQTNVEHLVAETDLFS